jgi:hypothetical protein
MALVLYIGVGLIGGFIIALPLFLIVAPALAGAMGGAVFESRGVLGGGLFIAGLCFVAYLPVLIVLGGALRSYVGTAWTLTYLELAGKTPVEVAPSAGD